MSALTLEHLISIARMRGIFAMPTPVGEVGAVLLGSLGLDLSAPCSADLPPHATVGGQILSMHCAGSIWLVDVACCHGKRRHARIDTHRTLR